MDEIKTASAMDKLVGRPLTIWMQSREETRVFQTTLMPSRFLRIDWSNSSKTLGNRFSKTPEQKNQGIKNNFCHSLEGVFADNSGSKIRQGVSVASLVEPTSRNPEFLPNKILRSLQSFFRFSAPLEPNLSSASLPVVVVHRQTDNYEVWLNNSLVANLPDKLQARMMQQKLTRLLQSSHLNPWQLRPALVDGIPALMAGNRLLLAVEKTIAQKHNRSGDLIAIEWVNNLRAALKVPSLSLVEGQSQMYGLQPSPQKMHGLASWYGGYFHGRQTANGEIYNQDELTVAHKSLPFNTFLQVKNLKTGKSVIVRVNDRGPYIPPRSLDLSRVAARCIQSEVAGVVPYEATIMQVNSPKLTTQGANLLLKGQKAPRKMAIASDF
ncbi:septal ring lytic transglycosylase RlpA family protein [Calothrix sp. 336/3]|uniref:septal ring lytic transglycosylase RlpA family protein n=2 Tax=Calothrix sp. 336/3 TaxID=1337936 RepID=UPI000A942B47